MKKLVLLFMLSVLFTAVNSQDYQISFAGTGESSDVDSVLVFNQNQQTELMIYEGQVLHLTDASSVGSMTDTNNGLAVYPNPFNETATVLLSDKIAGNIVVSIADINGRIVLTENVFLTGNDNAFLLTGLKSGVYFIEVMSGNKRHIVKAISTSGFSSPAIKVSDNTTKINQGIELKSLTRTIKNLVPMYYEDGDRLLLSCYAGNNTTILSMIPEENQTVTAEFVACTDPDGYHYAAVEIGNQKWMAENLKYLPSVVGPETWSETEPYYYVYGYYGTNVSEAKATENYAVYGVLYNWAAAMNGEASSASVPSGVKGVCPTGWHLPSDDEWKIMEGNVDSQYGAGHYVWNEIGFNGYDAGKRLKATFGWNNYGNGTDNYGFKALPGGSQSQGSYYYIGKSALWYTATDSNASHPWTRSLQDSYDESYRNAGGGSGGTSIRCVKN